MYCRPTTLKLLLLSTVPVSGKIAYLDQYPAANTNNLTEEERKSKCLEAFEFVQKQRRFQLEFSHTDKTEKLKLIMLIENFFASDDPFEIVPAYRCPTMPPIHIHVSFNGKETEPVYRIILKDFRVFPTQIKFTAYNAKLANRITEGKLELLLKAVGSIVKRLFVFQRAQKN